MNTLDADILSRSIDSEILQSMYRRKHKDRENLKTQLFSELSKYKQRQVLSSLASTGLLGENEVLLIISVVDKAEWIALSNFSVYYVDNCLKKIDYIDISKCSANMREIWEQGFVDFIENKGIEIIAKDSRRILLTVADTNHVNQTLADLISWAVHQVSLSEEQSLQIG